MVNYTPKTAKDSNKKEEIKNKNMPLIKEMMVKSLSLLL